MGSVASASSSSSSFSRQACCQTLSRPRARLSKGAFLDIIMLSRPLSHIFPLVRVAVKLCICSPDWRGNESRSNKSVAAMYPSLGIHPSTIPSDGTWVCGQARNISFAARGSIKVRRGSVSSDHQISVAGGDQMRPKRGRA